MKNLALVTLMFSVSACGQMNVDANLAATQTKAPTAVSTAVGKLIQIVALGGETTGFAVQNEQGELIEVDFKELKQFDSSALVNKQVQIDGQIEIYAGIEIPARKVLIANNARELVREYCYAFFSGANLNAFTGKCEQGTYGGCTNPFHYASVAQCETTLSRLIK